jgi:hypothetical protein
MARNFVSICYRQEPRISIAPPGMALTDRSHLSFVAVPIFIMQVNVDHRPTL